MPPLIELFGLLNYSAANKLTPSNSAIEMLAFNPCSHGGSVHARGNTAFRHHHMGRLLHRVGAQLPRWLDGQALIRESRNIERLCWRELGYVDQPIFEGDLPAFLMEDESGAPRDLMIPTVPVVLATRMAAGRPSALPASSPLGTNLSTMERLLNLSAFESQWLTWGCCLRRYGHAILPVIPLRDERNACEVLAVLCKVSMDMVRQAMSSRRLYAWGFLDGSDVDGVMPSVLSSWLSASDQFVEWIEHPYTSDADLLMALCKARVSLPVFC